MSSFASTAKRVIIAEDHDDFRVFLKESFEDAGYRVTECVDGQQLYDELLTSDTSDVAAVLSDHHMPGMRGLEVLERLRSKRPRAPFVLLTAFGNHDVHKRAKNLGADLVANKPLDEGYLVQCVRLLAGDV